IEALTQGTPSLLVKNGVMQLKQMRDSHISKQLLYANLRENGIYNLAKVKRVYLEACGIFSIYREDKQKPGLPLLPPDDKKILEAQTMPKERMRSCINCGFTSPEKENTACDNCGEDWWTNAIL